MKTFAIALLIPAAICAACSQQDTAATASPDAEASMPAPSPAPLTESAPAPAPAVAAVTPPDAEAPPSTAQVMLTPAAGNAVNGNLTLTSEGSAVTIRGEITGLNPGKEHGFHVHEVGQCALPDFASAGEHFNPTKDPHGGPKSKTRHLGDIANAKADKDGRATIDVSIDGVTLADKDGAPSAILGKALVVHAMPDDYKTQPSGDSGARIACGVIR